MEVRSLSHTGSEQEDAATRRKVNRKASLRGSCWTCHWCKGFLENRTDLAPGFLRRVVVCEPSAEATSRLRYRVLVGKPSSSSPVVSQRWPDTGRPLHARIGHGKKEFGDGCPQRSCRVCTRAEDSNVKNGISGRLGHDYGR